MEQITHVLSRLTFGARPGDAERVAAIGVDRWIAEQLRPDSIPDSAVVVALAPIPAWSQPAMAAGAAGLLAAPNRFSAAMRADSAAKRMTPLADSLPKRLVFASRA